MAVAREGQAGDGLVRGFECRAQPVAQRALAGAVDTLDDDEHAASVATLVSRSHPAAANVPYRSIIRRFFERYGTFVAWKRGRRLAVSSGGICCGTACDQRVCPQLVRKL